MSRFEGELLRQVLQQHGARRDLRLFRNHVGNGWYGKLIAIAKTPGPVNLLPGDAVIRGAKRLHSGLAVGSADLIGLQEGRFLSLELKTDNVDETPEQVAWGRMVTDLGGLHEIIRSVDDVDRVLGKPRLR